MQELMFEHMCRKHNRTSQSNSMFGSKQRTIELHSTASLSVLQTAHVVGRSRGPGEMYL